MATSSTGSKSRWTRCSCSRRSSTPSPVATSRSRCWSSKTSGDLAGVLSASFDRHGIQTFHAADGAQAILISQRELPDLLVLDLGLPEVDGFAVAEWLRRHERLHAMAVVVYTARDLDDGDRRRLQLGSTTQFLTKDRVTSSDLEQRVMGLLGRLTPATRLRRERCCAPTGAPSSQVPGRGVGGRCSSRR